MKGKAAAPAAAPAAPPVEMLTASKEELADGSDDHARPVYRYLRAPPGATGAESYQPIVEQDFQSPWTAPLHLHADTASYSNVRRFPNAASPARDAVRIEELLNYFRYDDPQPSTDAPEGCARCERAGRQRAVEPSHRRDQLQGRGCGGRAPSSNIVFLLDVRAA
jgi:Ca-activated chloride channel family protein